jgi:bla regulator protein blaR1
MADCLNWLVSTALTNAAGATLLAILAWAIARWSRSPALAHGLWAIVLLKLLTPPLVEVPVGWKLALYAQGPPPPSGIAEFREKNEPITALPAPRESPATHFSAHRRAATPLHIDVSPATAARDSSEPSLTMTVNHAVQVQANFRASATSFGWRRAADVTGSCLFVIWLGGIGISLIILARRAWAFQRFINRSAIIDTSLPLRVKQLASAAGLRTAPQILVVQGIVSPMLWGVGRRTTLIFPEQLLRQLPSAACDALVLHELAHYSRGDQWLRLLELVAQLLYWWHPVVWWARQEIEAAEEQCCDAWVVNRQAGSRRTYAEALLATIDFLCEPSPDLPPVASGLGEVPLLRIRLTQIMHGDLAAGLSASAKLTLLGIAATALPIGPALLEASVTPTPRSPAAQSAPTSPLQTPPSLAPEPPEAIPAKQDLGAVPPDKMLVTLRSLPAATQPRVAVTATAVSPNGKYQLQRQKGSQVTLINQATNWRLDMSAHGILCVAFTPDSRHFLTGHYDGLVRAWHSDTGGLVGTLKGSNGAVWSLDITAGDSANCLVAAGAKDGSILVWDFTSGDEVARCAPLDSSVSCLRWSPQGDRLAVSFGDFSNRENSILMIWSPLSNEVLAQISLEKPVAALAWLSNEDLFVADWNGAARLWQSDRESLGPPVSLGASGKSLAEAANWSAECPLVPAAIADPLAIRVD